MGLHLHFCASSQNQKWAVTSDDSGNSDISSSCAIDGAGNRYVAGTYDDTLMIDGVPYPNFINDGSLDAFVAKYNSNGIVQWVQTINGEDDQRIQSITVNSSTGEVYVSGIFYYSFIIDGVTQNSLEYSFLPGSFYRSFIAKFDTNGNLSWSNNTYSPTTSSIAGGYSIALAPDGNSIYFHSYYVDSLQMETGEQFSYWEGDINFGHAVNLLLRLSAVDGTVMSYHNDIDGYLVDGLLLTTDTEGNVIYAGSHRRYCMYQVDSSAFPICIDNIYGAIPQGFIWKMDENFGNIWGKEISGPGFQVVNAVACDNKNNIYAYGIFTGMSSFDTITIGVDSGKNNFFVTKLSPDGEYSYVKQFNGDIASNTFFPNDLEAPFGVDKKGNAYIGGNFADTLSMYSSNLVTETFPGLHYSNGFVLKLDNKGNLRWMQKYAGSTGAFDKTTVRGIAVNGSNIAVSGGFPNYHAYMGDTVTSDNDAFYLSALQDCDVKIKIIASNDSVDISNPVTLTAPLKASYSYQWQLNNVDISGATSNTYLATLSGNYRCIITIGVCEIVSNKIRLYPLREANVIENEISVYPNPAKNEFYISLPNTSISNEKVTISISDITGKILQSAIFEGYENSPVKIELHNGIASGTYVVTVISERIHFTSPLVIE